jgi:cytochrome c oxidase subunit III
MKLEVGETTVISEEIATKPRRQTFNPPNGGNSPNGNNGGGDQNDGNEKKRNPFGDDEVFLPNKSRIGMWFLMLIVIMTFGGLIGAYIVLATNKGLEWKPFSLPIQVWISTLVIIASTVTYEIYNRIYKKGEQSRARVWLLATATLGGIFIASQLIAWLELVNQGIYMAGNPYAGFFYIFTGVHVLHVIGGISAIGYLILKTKSITRSADELFKRQTTSTVVGWYWHTMDILWIVLFLLLGFWK